MASLFPVGYELSLHVKWRRVVIFYLLLDPGCWFSFRVYSSLLAPFSNLQSVSVLFSHGPVVSVVDSPLEFCCVLGFFSRVVFEVGKVTAKAFTPAWLASPSFRLRWSLLHGLTPFLLWQMKVRILLALLVVLLIVGGYASVKI